MALRVPDTQTATAFAVKVFMPNQQGQYAQIGTIKNINLTDDRGDTVIGGVGIGDRIIEYVPGRTGHSLAVSYFTLYKRSLFQALGIDDSVRMLSELVNSFIMYQEMPPPNGDEPIVTWYRGCVVTAWGKTQQYEADTVIVETATIRYASADDGSSALSADII